MKKLFVYLMAFFFCLTNSPAFAKNDLSIIASDKQMATLEELFAELEENDVSLKKVKATNMKSALNDSYLLVLVTPQSPHYEMVSEKLSASVKKELKKEKGNKFVLLRDSWKNGQEIILLAGNADSDIDDIRSATKDIWWEMMGNWFDFDADISGGY